MRGLPYRSSESEVEEFFDGFKLVPGSVKFEQGDDGRKTGWGAALSENEDQAREAQEGRDKQTLGTRWVGLTVISFSDYERFGNGGGSGGGGSRQNSSAQE